MLGKEQELGIVLGKVDARVEEELVLRYKLTNIVPMRERLIDRMSSVRDAYSDEEIIDIAHDVVQFVGQNRINTILLGHEIHIDQYLLHNIITVAITSGIKVLSCHGRYDELRFRRYGIPAQRF